ncbi:hypothetical protein Tcan_00277 [Toxocara canis]|uniref:Uncharacterized protein n=1 Tax=Toxocara canis TaxID=6265 RepID=A0A0B2UZM3_TOXCA|nr:hypothetical protein Tcan_00277 [Toxocara canis]
MQFEKTIIAALAKCVVYHGNFVALMGSLIVMLNKRNLRRKNENITSICDTLAELTAYDNTHKQLTIRVPLQKQIAFKWYEIAKLRTHEKKKRTRKRCTVSNFKCTNSKSRQILPKYVSS